MNAGSTSKPMSAITHFFRLPAFADEETHRACGLLNIILWFLILVTAILIISFLPIRQRPEGLVVVWDWSFVTIVVSWVFFGGLLRLVRHGRYQIVTRLLLAYLFVAISWSATAYQGLQDGSVAAYYLLVAVAALLLDGRAALKLTVCVILALIGMLVAQLLGYIHPPADLDHSLYELLVHSVLLVIFALILHLTMHNLRTALQQARHELAERQRTAQALQESERFTEAILNSLPNGIAVFNAQGDVVQVNVPWREREALGGVEPQALHNYHDVCQMVGRDEPEKAAECQQAIADLLQGQRPSFEVEYATADDKRWYLLRAVPLAHERGGLVVACIDVTDRHLVEEQARQQERLAAIGQLAAGIAHDFNNVLAVIILYAQLTMLDEQLLPAQKTRINTIVEQAERAATLVQQILDFSRRSVLERRPLALLPLLKEEVRLLARTLPDNVTVSLQVEGAPNQNRFLVNADLTRLQQVIMNLAVNARDAMPQGGALTFGLRQCTVTAAIALPQALIPPGQWVCLTVQDTGVGIPPAVLPHIFEPFYTTKAPGKGTGLGLAQVYGIVAQHEGHVFVAETGPEGTTFMIYLPAVAVAAANHTAVTGPALPHGRGERILVVEDNPATREALLVALQTLNYEPLVAENGRHALDLLTKPNPLNHPSPPIALVLTDHLMPAMDGLTLAATLGQQGFTLPVILITGYRPSETDEPLPELIKAQLLKPVDLDQLAQTLWGVLNAQAVIPANSPASVKSAG